MVSSSTTKWYFIYQTPHHTHALGRNGILNRVCTPQEPPFSALFCVPCICHTMISIAYSSPCFLSANRTNSTTLCQDKNPIFLGRKASKAQSFALRPCSMRVEGALTERGPVAAGGLVPKRPPHAPRKGRRRQKKVGSTASSAVQRLLEACKEVFADGGAGIVPSPDDVEWLRSLLGAWFLHITCLLNFVCEDITFITDAVVLFWFLRIYGVNWWILSLHFYFTDEYG